MTVHQFGLSPSLKILRLLCLFIGMGILGLTGITVPGAHSSSAPAAVQILTGYLDPGQREVYLLPHLKAGNTLYITMERLSGNLDPLFALADAHFDLKRFDAQLNATLQRNHLSAYTAFHNLLDSAYLAWDDDRGQGSNAALRFPVPADGDYKLVVAGSRQPVGREVVGQTFGDYRLTIGLNAPQVLTGPAPSTGALLAQLDRGAGPRPRIQEVRGALTPQDNTTYFRLANITPGAKLYARVEATSGDLKPSLALTNYGNKIIQVDNRQGSRPVAQIQRLFTQEARNFSLIIRGKDHDGKVTSGSFRLLVGLDAPEVLEGQGRAEGRALIRMPIQVGVGIRLDQITEVNQRGENFGAVGDLRLEWVDPAFAFNPDTCECCVKVFDSAHFEKFIADNQLNWPRVIFFNQQGKRWTQDEVFRIFPNGKVTYYERFSGTFQAPDFDFRRFPLDTQQFFIRLQALYPVEDYQFVNLPDLTGFGKQLGEEEWYIIQQDAGVSHVVVAEDTSVSRFSLRFVCQRHLSYYIFRIFVPLLLIIAVSWVTFFLQDYAKRVDLSGANLLVFIAFNFTIGSDLPRLGYLTLLDTVLIVAFLVTTLTVICNVALKRWDAAGKTELTRKIDIYILWGYPIFYVLGFFFLALFFCLTR